MRQVSELLSYPCKAHITVNSSRGFCLFNPKGAPVTQAFGVLFSSCRKRVTWAGKSRLSALPARFGWALFALPGRFGWPLSALPVPVKCTLAALPQSRVTGKCQWRFFPEGPPPASPFSPRLPLVPPRVVPCPFSRAVAGKAASKIVPLAFPQT